MSMCRSDGRAEPVPGTGNQDSHTSPICSRNHFRHSFIHGIFCQSPSLRGRYRFAAILSIPPSEPSILLRFSHPICNLPSSPQTGLLSSAGIIISTFSYKIKHNFPHFSYIFRLIYIKIQHMVRPLFSPPYVVNFELYFYSDSPIKMGSVRPVMIQNQDSATLPAQFPSPAPIKGLKIQPSVSASPLQAPRKEAARTQEYKTPPVEITSPQIQAVPKNRPSQ